MELAQRVAELLRKSEATGQSQMVAQATKLYDELLSKGLVEPPTYKIAPLNSVPPKAVSYVK